jgi:hypothetical protein
MFFGDDSNFLEFLPCEDFAHGVVRCIDDNHFGPRRDRATSKVVNVVNGQV